MSNNYPGQNYHQNQQQNTYQHNQNYHQGQQMNQPQIPPHQPVANSQDYSEQLPAYTLESSQPLQNQINQPQSQDHSRHNYQPPQNYNHLPQQMQPQHQYQQMQYQQPSPQQQYQQQSYTAPQQNFQPQYQQQSYNAPQQNFQPQYQQQTYNASQQMQQYPVGSANNQNGNALAPIPFFSPCNGRKKALLIGINYIGQSGMLNGCINDAKNMKRFLLQHYGFKDSSESIVMLTDDASDPNFRPTRQNIINAMRWLVNGASVGDSLVFHFSGHGGQVKDMDGDEDDGFDETILPVDYKTAGQIIDDEINIILVQPLVRGVRMLAVFDSCHSGSALDLPYQYLPDGRLKEVTMIKQIGSSIKEAGASILKVSLMSGLANIATNPSQAERAQRISRATKSSHADVISLAGCKDTQTSADTFVAGYGSSGAMSYALIKALTQTLRPTYGDLLSGVRLVLKNEYSQTPQLSSAKPMNMNEQFLL